MENYRHQEFHNDVIKKQQQRKYRDFLDDQIKYRCSNEPSPSNSTEKKLNDNSANKIIIHDDCIKQQKKNCNKLQNSYSNGWFFYLVFLIKLI